MRSCHDVRHSDAPSHVRAPLKPRPSITRSRDAQEDARASEALLEHELIRRDFRVARQVSVDFEIDGVVLKRGLRVDLLVNELVVVEIKADRRSPAVHRRQLLTYLRAMGLPLGLLINFGGVTMKEGLSRVVNNHDGIGSPLRIHQPERESALRRWLLRLKGAQHR